MKKQGVLTLVMLFSFPAAERVDLQERAESVQRLFEEARRRQIDETAPHQFNRARAALEAAQAALAFEQQKSGLFRDLEKADRLLRKSQARLRKAFQEGQDQKEKWAQAVKADLLRAQHSIDQTWLSFEQARQPDDEDVQVASDWLFSELLEADRLVKRGQGYFQQEDLVEASRLVEQAETLSEGIRNHLELQEKWLQKKRKFEVYQPRGLYIVVDTAFNRLYLKEGDDVLLDAVCSTGSGAELETERRSWTFDTPRGKFRIRSKVEDPVWRKPDWAFLEEGLPIPKNNAGRFEKGVLGEYALEFKRGYFIHGTLYNNLLGQSVTHGCIRLRSEDLIYLGQNVPVGTPVYIR